MHTFIMSVKETQYSDDFEVEAETEVEAIKIVEKMLEDGKVSMDDIGGHFDIEVLTQQS